MKICIISSSLYSQIPVTGVEVLVKRTVSELIQQGHNVLVITTNPRRSTKPCIEEIDGAKVYSFYPLNIFERSTGPKHSILTRLIYHGIDQLWNLQPYRIIKSILAQEKPDIVHVYNWRGFSPSAFDAIKSVGLPLVLTAYDYLFICPLSSLLRRSGEICINQPPLCRLYKATKRLTVGGKPDVVTSGSQFVLNKLNQNGLFKDTKCVRLFYGIGLDNVDYVGKKYEVIDILYSGRLHSSKGVHILIDAFKQLNYRNIKLHIVGVGLDAEKLKRSAEGDSRIIFYGFVPEEELRLFYKKAHITVVPSIWYEPFGMIIIESFKYGTPVVASNIGGIPEIIENGYNGLLFEPGNVSELKATLENLIENPSELKRLSQGAFESVKKYDISDYVVKLQELYGQLIR